MKKALLLIFLLTMVGCIQQLSTNIEQSNELMRENLELMSESKAAILANTEEIQRSTAGMQRFEFIFPIVFVFVVLVFAYVVFRVFHKILNHFKK